jgi:TIR domain
MTFADIKSSYRELTLLALEASVYIALDSPALTFEELQKIGAGLSRGASGPLQEELAQLEKDELVSEDNGKYQLATALHPFLIFEAGRLEPEYRHVKSLDHIMTCLAKKWESGQPPAASIKELLDASKACLATPQQMRASIRILLMKTWIEQRGDIVAVTSRGREEPLPSVLLSSNRPGLMETIERPRARMRDIFALTEQVLNSRKNTEAPPSLTLMNRLGVLKNRLEREIAPMPYGSAQNLRTPRYFNPEDVLPIFEDWFRLRDDLQRAMSFARLPVREAPRSSGTTDFGGRGYIERSHLERLLKDILHARDLLHPGEIRTRSGDPHGEVVSPIFMHGSVPQPFSVQTDVSSPLAASMTPSSAEQSQTESQHMIRGGDEIDDDTRNGLLANLDEIEQILNHRSRNNDDSNNERYVSLRRQVMQTSAIRARVPKLLVSCANLKAYWLHIKHDKKTVAYAERDAIVANELAPLRRWLEGFEDQAGRSATEDDMSSVKIFIGHSSEDKEIASLVVEVLEASANLPHGTVRCTSLPGYELEIGAHADNVIRENLRACQVFVGLITESSLRSHYVLMEMGAAWAYEKFVCPLLSSDVSFGQLPAQFRGVHAIRMQDSPGVTNFATTVARKLGHPAIVNAPKANVAIGKLCAKSAALASSSKPFVGELKEEPLPVTEEPFDDPDDIANSIKSWGEETDRTGTHRIAILEKTLNVVSGSIRANVEKALSEDYDVSIGKDTLRLSRKSLAAIVDSDPLRRW